MKRITGVLMLIAAVALFIAMGVMGVKIFTHNYDIVAECYAAMGCWAVFLLCVLLRALQSKCPHCGRLRVSRGAYCPFCGKEMKE